MTPFRPRPLTATLLLGLGTASSSFADTALQDLSAAGEMNVLVHKAMSSACMISAGAAVDNEMQALAQTRTRMNTLLAATSDGALAEEADAITTLWAPVDMALSMILAGDAPTRYDNVLADGHSPLGFATLAMMDAASQRYEQVDSVAMTDVVTFDVAERQEVYVQKIKLTACQVGGAGSAEAVADLKDAMDLFQRSLVALRDGAPEMGVVASENYVVQQAIAAADFDWGTTRPMLDRIIAAGAVSVDDLSALQVRSAAMESRMRDLVQVYLAPVDAEGVPQVALLDVTSR